MKTLLLLDFYRRVVTIYLRGKQHTLQEDKARKNGGRSMLYRGVIVTSEEE